jgi:hypothetical protein
MPTENVRPRRADSGDDDLRKEVRQLDDAVARLAKATLDTLKSLDKRISALEKLAARPRPPRK